jgi:flavocytochrome c
MYDIIIIGGGSAGMTCAITAAQRGRKVLVVEKDNRIGGTLHVSAGHMSAGGTQMQARKGIDDDVQRHYDDVMRINNGSADAWMIRMACEEAPHTLNWLDELGMRWGELSPSLVYGHVPYQVPRTHFGANNAISVLEVLQPLFDAGVASGHIDVKLNHKLTDLLLDGQKTIGVVTQGPEDGPVEFYGQHVVLSTGGYAANHAMFAQKHPNLSRLVSTASPNSQGEGAEVAERNGAVFHGAEKALSTNGGIELEPGSGRSDFWGVWAQVSNGVTRPPAEIYVNDEGQRFMDETEHSPDVRERVVEALPKRRFFVVFDENIRTTTPNLLLWWTPEQLLAETQREKAMWKADSIEALAQKTGLPVEALNATIARYNTAVDTQNDPDFGRRRLTHAISQPPYYAVLTYAINLITFGGIKVNENLEVMHQNGQPITNLYAIGEILGAGATSGNAFCGGMLLTPALSFGRILGRRL